MDQNADSTRLYQTSASLICANCYMVLADQDYLRLFSGFFHVKGEEYAYLTDDFSLEPGKLAFIYHRRWDEEEFFDNFKNDLAGAKAWGKTPIAIEQQTILGLSTYLLTRLFLDQQFEYLALENGNTPQSNKHQKKIETYKKEGGIRLRAYWQQLSKSPIQVWRFFNTVL